MFGNGYKEFKGEEIALRSAIAQRGPRLPLTLPPSKTDKMCSSLTMFPNERSGNEENVMSRSLSSSPLKYGKPSFVLTETNLLYCRTQNNSPSFGGFISKRPRSLRRSSLERDV